MSGVTLWQNSPATLKEGVPPHKEVVNIRSRRLLTKNTYLCKFITPCMGLKLAQCRKVKKVGDLIIGEPAIKTLVNDDHNYNGLDVKIVDLKIPLIELLIIINQDN